MSPQIVLLRFCSAFNENYDGDNNISACHFHFHNLLSPHLFQFFYTKTGYERSEKLAGLTDFISVNI